MELTSEKKADNMQKVLDAIGAVGDKVDLLAAELKDMKASAPRQSAAPAQGGGDPKDFTGCDILKVEEETYEKKTGGTGTMWKVKIDPYTGSAVMEKRTWDRKLAAVMKELVGKGKVTISMVKNEKGYWDLKGVKD